MREEAGFLKHIADGTFVGRNKDVLVAVLPDFIIDPDNAVRGFFQAGDTAQASGLAGAGRAIKRGYAGA